MAVRNAVLLNINVIKNLRNVKVNRTILLDFKDRANFYLNMTYGRNFSNCVITQNIKLNTVNPVLLETTSNSSPKVKTTESRPLVVLLEYLNAKEKHIMKFVELYMDYGFDVLQIHLKPWQLLWPTKGSQMVAKDVAQFLATNDSFSPMVVHGFSVGAYLWGEVLIHFSRNLALYQPIADKIKCKIFDSAVDVNDIPHGFPHAMFPKNPFLRSTCEKYLRYHLKTFYEESTKYYRASRKEFSSGIVKCPTLMVTSNADPLSSVMVNEAVRQELATRNLECFVKIFEGSKHVGHFRKHKEEYISEIEEMFRKVNLLQYQKLKAKL